MATPKLLDLDGVRERLDFEDELVAELAQRYVERAPAQLSAVSDAIRKGDPKALEYAAHFFKGALAIFGAEAAVTLVQTLEDLGQAGQMDGAAAKLVELENLTRQLDAEIVTFILGQKL